LLDGGLRNLVPNAWFKSMGTKGYGKEILPGTRKIGNVTAIVAINVFLALSTWALKQPGLNTHLVPVRVFVGMTLVSYWKQKQMDTLQKVAHALWLVGDTLVIANTPHAQSFGANNKDYHFGSEPSGLSLYPTQRAKC
jgi:hypothetical protein